MGGNGSGVEATGGERVSRVVGVDEMTIVNWERYSTVPKRHHAKIRSLCEFLELDISQVMIRFAWTTALSQETHLRTFEP